jgi:nickel/cobalt transporter (NicO) family protein
MRRSSVWTLAAAAAILAIMASAHAQALFSFGRSMVAPNGVAGWLMERQSAFYRALAGAIRASRTDRSAVLVLLGLSFTYGIFHAAGPGHGKAVIASYLVANAESWRRGVVLSIVSALAQGLVAIALVSVGAVLIGATARSMGNAVWVVETASYLLIIAVGARLLWVKGGGFLAALGQVRAVVPVRPKAAGHAPRAVHDHPTHAHSNACSHSHGPEPAGLAGPGGWRRGVGTVVAVGLRPCSGAILVLVFALAQGMFLIGIAAALVMAAGTAVTVTVIASFAIAARGAASQLVTTRDGIGALALRGFEVAAAVLVIGFGVLLLLGFMATERLIAI